MALPWARIDTNIASHDKILALVNDPSPRRFQALSTYLLSVPWSVGAETNGRVAPYALQTLHSTTACARLLVKYRLWSEAQLGWEIVNFDRRNPTAEAATESLTSKRIGAAHGNCKRWHGPGCWRDGKCSK